MRSTTRIRFGDGRVVQCRVELEGVAPPLWRRLLVSERASLHELHVVIEHGFDRDGESEYRIEADGVRYTALEAAAARGNAADRVSLEDLELHVGARLLHVAESHGEPWRHVITIEQLAPRFVGQRLPACTAGGRASPPDACAGPVAYRELLAALADPFDPRAAEWQDWLPEQFDPDYADMPAINAALARVPKRRPAA